MSDHEQRRLLPFLDEAAALVENFRTDKPWTLRLDVGRSPERDLLNGADLDNYLKPLATRLNDPHLVSVWCTKQYGRHSYLRADFAHETLARTAKPLLAMPTASYEKQAYKEQIQAAVADTDVLPPGPVRLELAFLVGPGRKWWHLWKPTIDALEPLLGRDSFESRPWHPADGRITELGMHLAVDPALGHDVSVAIDVAPIQGGG